jgi:hypothetical protein
VEFSTNYTNNYFSKNKELSETRWSIPVIPALGRLRQESLKAKDSLGYIVTPFQTNKQTEQTRSVQKINLISKI